MYISFNILLFNKNKKIYHTVFDLFRFLRVVQNGQVASSHQVIDQMFGADSLYDNLVVGEHIHSAESSRQIHVCCRLVAQPKNVVQVHESWGRSKYSMLDAPQGRWEDTSFNGQPQTSQEKISSFECHHFQRLFGISY